MCRTFSSAHIKMDKTERNNLIQELADLSEFEGQNMERMREIASILVQEYMHPETKQEPKGYEYAHLRVCRHGIQRESCYDCLFEPSCHLEDIKKDTCTQLTTDVLTH